MYFTDLTKYTYSENDSIDSLVNIGWLSVDHDFITGEVSDVFLEKLWEYSHFAIASKRGFHTCDLCDAPLKPESPIIEYSSESLKVGSAEIRIFGKSGKIYATPNLLFHYITEHSYVPPEEFIHSVENGLNPYSEEYRNKLTNNFKSWKELKNINI